MNKIFKAMINVTCGLLCCCNMAHAQTIDNSEVMLLNANWEFAKGGTDKWMTAIVPGTVHQDLRRHEMIPDPFYGLNEKEVQGVENEDWAYRTSFVVSEEQLQRDGALLSLEGLDTYADVYLNGALLLKADNMFVGYSVPVKSVLRKGENKLQIYFHSPINHVLPQFESNGFNYPADNETHPKHLSVFTRKAPYSYGWDWGIRLVTSGVWRPVKLRFYDVATIEDFCVKQLSVTDRLARTSNQVTINNILNESVSADLRVVCSLNGENKGIIDQAVTLQPGVNRIDLPLEVINPVRWMPNGWGKPTLYDFSAQLICRDKLVAQQHHRIGLRTIKVVNEKDAHGESFYFEVNGIPMFAKGANFIPDDALLPSVTDARYRTLFRDMKEAHMNMVRVWGGGTYEDDRFYNLADENGILVWQDFMFACTAYPSDPAFLKRVEAEADYNIRRLRNHASLAMWCGNNEVIEALKYWGYQKDYSADVYKGFMTGYDKIFRELLPRKVKELDGDKFYVHSSPYFSNWGDSTSWATGDSHNWGVWHGKKSFETLDTDLPRFMSEFGFQAFPEMKTIATFADPKDYQIESEVMNNHQKSGVGNALIKTYMGRDYIIPERFEDFVYVGLVLQGHGMRHGFEAHRRNRPYCMGTLYWQLNDSWPVVSWSSIDYYGNWKALHYQAKRAFAPLLINPIVKKDSLEVYLISDQLESLQNVNLEMKLIDFDGKVLGKRSAQVLTLNGNSSQRVYSELLAGLVTDEQRNHSFLQLTLKDKKGHLLSEETFFFSKTKDLKLPETKVTYQMKVKEGSCEVTLSSPKLAKDVFVEIPIQGARFTDNFFDLLPGQTRRIVITSPEIKKEGKLNVSIKHIRETYH